YAFAYGTNSGVVEDYVVAGSGAAVSVYSWDGSTLTSRASYVLTGARGQWSIKKYGDVAIVAFAGHLKAATLFTNNFSDISGSPTGCDILAVQSNAVLAFSESSNAWNASDVGDYTNWSTGEAASGNIISHPGNITAAVAYGPDVYAFKQGSIHRMTYVGGSIKWQIQTAWVGSGVPRPYSSTTASPSQDWAIATQHGIAYYGGNGRVYLFDGSSFPVCLNPLTTIPVEAIGGIFVYDPTRDTLCIAPSQGSSSTGTALDIGASTKSTSLYYYYNFQTQMWGNGVGSDAELGGLTNGSGAQS